MILAEQKLTLTEGDTAPVLDFVVSADLTGALAVVAHILCPDKTVLTKAVTITDATTGTGFVDWVTDDLDQVGSDWFPEIQVTFSNGKIQTFALDAAGNAARFRTRAQIA